MNPLLTRVGLVVLSALIAAGAVGCSKEPKNLTPLPAGRSGGAAPTGSIPVDPGAGTGRLGPGGTVSSTDLTGTYGDGTFTGDPTLSDLNPADAQRDRMQFASDTIYFDFDKSNVKSQYNANVRVVADYLKSHPSESVLIEGHCDERGTEEYNRALGERRALSVRERLLALGVNTDQIATISYGEEKPVAFGRTEADFAKNRRAEFVLLVGLEPAH